ncbi:MAG: glycosyltransferase [Prevotella sp.]|nr:glycosyltransferase [Prevotella sp.]
MIIYSIIIPHHNIPNLLQRCLASIPRREDTEVIVVDDASDAHFADELEAVMAAHPDVCLLKHEQCIGGGGARNTGLAHAIGRYVIFADADDFFNDCFAEVLEDYYQSDDDIIFFKGNSIDTNTMIPANRADHLNRFVDDYQSGKDANGEQLRYIFGEPWARMTRRAMIEQHHIRFEETFIHNDSAFGYLTGFHAQSIRADNRAIYCVTVRQGSVSRIDSLDRILTRINVFGRAEQFLSLHHVKTIPTAHYEQLVRLLVHGRLNVFGQCINVLRRQGFSLIHIINKTIVEFFCIMKNKLTT